MSTPTNGYLKCYYGYQNFGDEILAFGVINRIFSTYPRMEKLYIEVGNKARFDARLDTNRQYLDIDLCKLETIQKDNIRKILRFGLCNPKALKFFGGGEVFTEARGWLHGGRNYLLLYPLDFVRKNVVLLGGFGTPTRFWMKLLYRLTLKRCQKIVVREHTSLNIVGKYLGIHKDIVSYHPDFSTEVVKKWQHCQKQDKKATESQEYHIINLTPYSQTMTDLEAIRVSVDLWGYCQYLFFPCGHEDLDTLGQLKVITPNIMAYYRRNNDIDTTLTLMSKSSTCVGSRLHFIFILHLLGVKVKSIVYQEKVKKFLEEYHIPSE